MAVYFYIAGELVESGMLSEDLQETEGQGRGAAGN